MSLMDELHKLVEQANQKNPTTGSENNQMNTTAATRDEAAVAEAHSQILQNLAALAGKSIKQDDPTLTFPSRHPLTVEAKERRIGIPEGMPAETAVEVLNEHIDDQKQVAQIKHDFNARFEEVMVATFRVMRREFGTVGKGMRIPQMFGGSEPPRTQDFVVGLDAQGQPVYERAVPVSPFTFAPLGANAVISPNMWMHPEYGRLGSLIFEVRKETAPAVEGLIVAIEAEIRSASIYKGKVLDLARGNDGEYKLKHKHVNVDQFLVYNPDVAQDMQYEVWGNIEQADVYDRVGMKSVFKVGMEGMYGSGKTETAMRTARLAADHGVTAVIVKPSVTDKITDLVSAFRIAEMYAPSLLVIEDWDKFFTSGYTQADESTLTNLLDGADSKTHRVSVLWTTNNLDLIPKSMMRNGRTDATITFGPLERGPVESMFRAVLGDELKEGTDFDAVYEEVKDLGPSFIRGTFDKARKYSIITNRGQVGMPLGTEDLIQAARVMKKQVNRFENAKATEHKKPTLDSLFANAISERVAQVVRISQVDLEDGEIMISDEELETLKA